MDEDNSWILTQTLPSTTLGRPFPRWGCTRRRGKKVAEWGLLLTMLCSFALTDVRVRASRNIDRVAFNLRTHTSYTADILISRQLGKSSHAVFTNLPSILSQALKLRHVYKMENRKFYGKLRSWQAHFTVNCGTIKLKLDCSHYRYLVTGLHCTGESPVGWDNGVFAVM